MASSSSITILHVDDEPDFAEMAAEFIERQNDRISVETASDADEGLDRIEAEDFDCIVSDFDMPGETGIEFLEIVREHHEGLPFILYTGKGSEEVASDAISAGVTDYLQKASGTSQYEVLANRIENAVTTNRAQREVETVRYRYHRLIEESTDAIVIVDEEGTFSYLSPAAERVLGYQPEELIGEIGFDYIHEDDRQEMMDIFSEAIDAEDEYATGEYRFKHKDGSWRWIEGRGRDLLDDPVIEGIVVYARDITGRKEDEQRLEQLKDRFQGFVDTSSDVISVVGENGVNQYVSPSAERVLGYTPDTLVGEDVLDYIHPADRERVAQAIAETIETPETVTERVEYRFKHADGSWIWLESVGSNQTDTAIGGYVVTSRDITDRKEREEGLERYKTIIEATGDPVYTLDDVGNITYVNEAALDLSSYDEQELLGANATKIMSEEHFGRGTELIQSLLSSEQDRGTFEMEFVTADGEHIPCEIHVALLPSEDDFRGTIGVIRDISERVKRKQRLERERDRLDEFASIVSHDLRNPLMTAKGSSELAREEGNPEHFDRIDHSLDRMDRLIDDVLWLAREGQELGTTEEVALAEAIEDSWEMVAPDGVEAALVYDEGALGSLTADYGFLCQVLENVLGNAITHGGPGVTVRVERFEEGVAIEDGGPGIPDSIRDQVFEEGVSTVNDGTGFGLYIVEQIAEVHGWKVDVTESEAGGTRIEITDIERSVAAE
jgi:PAS domain S-box-containing protein